jgi:predicted dinucleotide-binding enzyme
MTIGILGTGDVGRTLANAFIAGGPPDMFFGGNDDAAKKTVAEVLKSFGWETIDIGGIEGARLLEPLCMLWLGYAMRNGSLTHAFKLLRK